MVDMKKIAANTKNNKFYIGGISCEHLINEFGSPLYVYDAETIRQSYKKLKENIGWKNLKILYACKANTNFAIMKILKDCGAGIDAVSTNEIRAALKIGFTADQILYTGNNMTDEEMDFAAEKGVMINIGSLSRLEKFGKKYDHNRNICVRINPNVDAEVHPHLRTATLDSKFGIHMGYLDKIKEIVKSNKINVAGVHCHLGTTIMDPQTFFQGMDEILKAAKEFEGLKFIDIGGGPGIPYRPDQTPLDIAAVGAGFRQRMDKFVAEYGSDVELWMEPGRYLVCESGYLISKVNTIKSNPKKKFIGLDTNMAHLARPVTYDAYHHIINGSRVEGDTENVDVVGNACESGDFLGRDRMITKTEEGDIYIIFDAGAYGYSQSSNYNLFGRPAEVLIEKGKARLIRKRESFEYLEQNQVFE